MKNCCLYIMVFNALLFVSCANKNNPYEDLKITSPKQIELYNPYLSDSLHSKITLDTLKQIKLYTTINVSCVTCILKLEKWDRFHSDLGLHNNNVAIIPICYSGDGFESFKYFFENDKMLPIKIPLVLDVDNSFVKQNKSLLDKYGDFTALTDSKNNVILIGNPIENEKDKNDFIQAIRTKKIRF